MEVPPRFRAAHQAFAQPPCHALRRSQFPQASSSMLEKMETVGFEPTTPCLQSRCSPTELRPRGRGCQQLHPSRSTATLARHHTVTQGKPHSAQQNVVGQGGLEPPTPRLSSVCSNQLSYWPRTCGVAQSGEGCAVGARRDFRRDQAHRQGRLLSNSQDLGERLPNPSVPSGTTRPGSCRTLGSLERRHPRIPKDPSGRHP